MKPKWVCVVLAVSLVGNAVELGILGFQALQRAHRTRRFYTDLESRAAQLHDRVMMPEFTPAREALRRQYYLWESQLNALCHDDEPDPARVNELLCHLAQTEKAKLRLMFESARAMERVENPRQRESLRKRWKQMTGVE